MIENKSERLTTLGFGIPNLIKSGEVGYFPEEFIKDFRYQGMTALEIKRDLMRSGTDIDGDVIGKWTDKTKSPELMYFVNLKDNIFHKYIMDDKKRGNKMEKLYTVEIGGVGSSKLFKNTRKNKYRFHCGKELEGYTDKLTEQEIKKADERLWEFAKPVEEK